MSERDNGLPSRGQGPIEGCVLRVDPRSYRAGDRYRPIGSTTTVGGDLVHKWAYNTATRELRPVWPSQHHKTVICLDEWERTVRIIYDPATHAILTRTVESSAGMPSPVSFELQKQAFLSASRDDAGLRWMPDGDRYVVRGPETAHIPAGDQHLLRTREMVLRAAE